METKIESVDLTSIDWNNLSVEEFNLLETKLAERDKELKEAKIRKKRISPNETINIKLQNNVYTISLVLYTRLKELTSEKSKQTLIKEIIETHSPINICEEL